MLRKTLSVLLAACVIVCCLPCLPLAAGSVWGGGVSQPPVKDGVYIISSGEQLAWFALTVNGGASALKARLDADITLNSGTPSGSWRRWTPIGTATSPYTGVFDGGGCTVSGLYIDGVEKYCGLFGYIGASGVDASVSSVNIANSSITAGQYSGSVVGFIYNASLNLCSSDATVVSSANDIGGIVGMTSNAATVIDCTFSGSVSAGQRVGGIVGYCFSNSIVSGCKSSGTVTGTLGNIGGIAGTLSGSSVEYSYCIGSVSGTARIGGIVGNSAYGTLKCCYSIASTSATETSVGAVVGSRNGGSVLNCYYDAALCSHSDSYAELMLSADMKTLSFVSDLNGGAYAYIFDYLHANNGYPIHVREFGTLVWTGKTEQPEQDVSGTYLIDTGEELAWFAGLVNGTLPSVPRNTAANARLTNYILLNFGTLNSQSNMWTPVGSASAPYTGTFDAAGFAVAGVYVPRDRYSSVDNTGFFGYIGQGGKALGLKLEASEIYGKANVGGIAGYCAGQIGNCLNTSDIYGTFNNIGGITGTLAATGSITGCFNSGTVSGNYYVGGIVGTGYAAINSSCNSGTVSANVYAGGIVGYMINGFAERCFNGGTVTSKDNYSGGISGYSLSRPVTDCYNSGSVSGYAYCGGILGLSYMSTITRCYNAGSVSTRFSSPYVGAILGQRTDGALYNCYYDSEASGASDVNATALTTLQMSGSGALSALSGFSSSVWAVRANNDEFFNFYPQLTVFANSVHDNVRAASLRSVKRLKSSYTNSVTLTDGTEKFFTGLAGAIAYIGTGGGTVKLLADEELSSTVVVDGTVTLITDGYVRTLSRSVQSMSDRSMFSVNGTLSLGSTSGGSDSSPLLILDGNSSLTGGRSVIQVNSGGALRMNAGSAIRNNASSVSGGAVYIDGGMMSMYGGTVSACSASSASSSGGGIYAANGATLYLEGGKITGCAAQYGGGIGVSGATVIHNGGSVTGNSSGTGLGGGIYCDAGEYVMTGGSVTLNECSGASGGGICVTGSGSLEVSGTAEIKSNKALVGSGGAISVLGTRVTLSGGSITGNTALRNGGAVLNLGTLTVGAAVISSNKATGFGSAVYSDGKLYLNRTAAIDTGNDIYLVKGRTVTTDAKLLSSAAAVITPAEYSPAVTVLDGDACAYNRKSLTVTPSGGVSWYINSGGFLCDHDPAIVARVYKTGSSDYLDYTSLSDAVSGVGASIATVYLLADDVISRTANASGNVTVLAYGGARTVTRAIGFTGAMFSVGDGASLKLGKSDNSDVGTLLTLDGGGRLGRSGSCIISTGTGTVNIYSGTKLAYNYGGSAVDVRGSFYMYGGEVSGCSSQCGGGFTVTGGSLYLLGGKVSGNSAVNGGGIFLDGGEVRLSANAALRSGSSDEYTLSACSVSGNSATNGGGFYVVSGNVNVCGEVVLNKTGGNVETLYKLVSGGITGNTASKDGGGICIRGGCVNMDSSLISQNTAAANGGGVFVDTQGSFHTADEVTEGFYDFTPDSGETMHFSFDGGKITANTAHRGNQIYSLGALSLSAGDIGPGSEETVYSSGSVSLGDTVSFTDGSKIALGEAAFVEVSSDLTEQTAVILLAPDTYDIGITVISGAAFTSNAALFSPSDELYYIDADGRLNSGMLVLRSSSLMTTDRPLGLVYGLDTGESTVSGLMAQFSLASPSDDVEVLSRSGAVLGGDDAVTTGCVIRRLDRDGKELHRYILTTFGDVDGDGFINASDAMLAWLVWEDLISTNFLGDAGVKAADVNHDGVVDAFDFDLLEKAGIFVETISQR